MKIIFYILTVILLITSCEEQKEEVQATLEKVQPKQVHFPVLIDTFQFDATYKQEQKHYVANYRPLYFGEKKDTININYNLPSYYLPPSDLQEVIEDSNMIIKRELARQQLKINNQRYSAYYKKAVLREYLNWKNSKLNIIVDT